MGLAEARLSRFFGFDCRNLTPAEKLDLQANMITLKAEEELARGRISDDRVYDVVLAATGSEERASAALTARLASRMEQRSKAT